MNKLSPDTLDKILDEHKKWLDTKGQEGQRAELCHKDLSEEYLFETNCRFWKSRGPFF